MEKVARRSVRVLRLVCLGLLLLGGCIGSPEEVGTGESEVTGIVLKSIAVTPSPTTLFAGATQALTATGFYSDASTRDLTSVATWTSSNPSVATVSAAGGVTTIAHGSATITAQSGTIKGKATIKVSVTLTSVSIAPATATLPAHTTQVLKATGTYDNGTTKNLTSTTTWTSNNPAIATVTSTGMIVTVSPGVATIMATTTGSSTAPVVGTTTITVDTATVTSVAVTPVSKKLPLGAGQQYTATATFSDGTKYALVSPVVTWTSSAPNLATIATTGRANAVAIGGPLLITAAPVGSSVTGTAALTVTAATLVSVAVTPATSSLAAGLTQQLTATGTYTDGTLVDLTSQVTWASSTPAVASVASTGIATAIAPGSTAITATDPKSHKAATVTLAVTPAVLQSIALSPVAPSVPAGLTIALAALGTWTDGTTQDLTATANWTSSAPSIATVSAGVVTAIVKGTTTIAATDPQTGVTKSVIVTVTPGALVSIAITPTGLQVPLDTTAQLVATATYTDGSTGDVTQSTTWTSSTQAIAVANAPGPAGQVTALSIGTSTVSATDATTGIAGITIVSATPAILESLSITPAASTLLTGQTEQLVATGTMSDGSTTDYTNIVAWTSSSPAAYVTNHQSGSGLAIGVRTGDAVVTATDPTTHLAATASVGITVRTNDDAAAEFSSYVDPIGNWAYGWETTPGAGFHVDQYQYLPTGWEGADGSNVVFAFHNASDTTQGSAFGQTLAPGELVLIPPFLGSDASLSDCRWTAPSTGTFQITASFAAKNLLDCYVGETTTTQCVWYGCPNPGARFLNPGQSDVYTYVTGPFSTATGTYTCPTSSDGCWYETRPDDCGLFGLCRHDPYVQIIWPAYGCTTTTSVANVDVLYNGAPIFTGYLNTAGAGNAQTVTTSLAMTAGDTLDFEVGNAGVTTFGPGAGYYDLVTFDAHVATCGEVGLTACGDTCADTASDLNNCGACGNACAIDPNAAAQSCTAGQCVTTCNPGYTLSSTGCVDPLLARYWRIQLSDLDTAQGSSAVLTEVEFQWGGTVQTLGANAISSPDNWGGPGITSLVDGSLDQSLGCYGCDYAYADAPGKRLDFDLASPQAVESIFVSQGGFREADGLEWTIASLDVYSSQDGITYTLVRSFPSIARTDWTTETLEPFPIQ